MPFLFEYGEWASINNSKDLKQMLQVIWADRLFTEALTEDQRTSHQPFLHFDGDLIRARNYSGFIQRENELIEIYPKVFRDHHCQDKVLMLNHIFYWLSYCRKWKFPFTQSGLDKLEVESFPELIINLIANQIYSTVTNHPLAQYQEVEEALFTPRGSINFNRYINQSLTNANFHLIECDHEPFVFDNKANRVIKYCCRLLLSKTVLSENIRILQEVIYHLDEVTDTVVSLKDAESIVLNHFFDDYIDVIDSCKLILGQQLYSGKPYDLSQWCLLLPMEYIFEDFIAGFLERHFSTTWKVHYQKSDLYLSDQPQAFNLQHDIFLTHRTSGKKLIIDAKYKVRDKNFKSDPKKGVSQNDLYQMVSYAYKRGCSEVVLIYPNVGEEIKEPDVFEIGSGFDPSVKIKVRAMEVPFWSMRDLLSLEQQLMTALKEL